MIRGNLPRGYTIIEVMVFLAVSAILMTSALLVVSGQQRKTEFSQAVREFESRILDIMNDVSVGYYPSNDQVRCLAPPSGGAITLSGVAGTKQGTNSGCTFIGRVIQFAPSETGRQSIRVYSVAGRRQVNATSGREVSTINQAQPTVLANTGVAGDLAPDVFEDIDIGAIRIDRVTYRTGSSNINTGGIGFFTGFNKYSGNSLNAGSITPNLAPIPDNQPPNGIFTALDQDSRTFARALNAEMRHIRFSDTFNPSRGATICLRSLGTNQLALLTMGGSSGGSMTRLEIRGGTTCPSSF